MEQNSNKYGIVIEIYDGIEYVIYEGLGLAIKHIEDYDIEFEYLTPEQLVFIWLEEIEKIDESKLDEKHRNILKEIRDVLDGEEGEEV